MRVALLDADVALPVARDFVGRVKSQAVGAAVLKSVTPGQMVIKIVHDELIATLRGGAEDEDGSALKIDSPPAPIMMVGLQGSGKTTTTAKLARGLKEREWQERCCWPRSTPIAPPRWTSSRCSGRRSQVDTLPIVKGQTPVEIAKRAKQQASARRLRRATFSTPPAGSM